MNFEPGRNVWPGETDLRVANILQYLKLESTGRWAMEKKAENTAQFLEIHRGERACGGAEQWLLEKRIDGASAVSLISTTEDTSNKLSLTSCVENG